MGRYLLHSTSDTTTQQYIQYSTCYTSTVFLLCIRGSATASTSASATVVFLIFDFCIFLAFRYYRLVLV